MCLSSPKAPEAPPLPQLQPVAQIDESQGLKRRDETRNKLLVKRQGSVVGAQQAAKNVT